MAVLCREFGISRKTGYKILGRYHDSGLEALTNRSRRPYRQANQLAFQVETLIVRLKQEKPTWGAPKIRERLKGFILTSMHLRYQPFTRCSIAMGWSSAASRGAIGRKERPFPKPSNPTSCGAPITRASSCSRTGVTAIP